MLEGGVNRRGMQPQTLNPKPQTPNPKLQTCKAAQKTVPKLQQSCRKCEHLKPKPQTLNPKPQTPNLAHMNTPHASAARRCAREGGGTSSLDRKYCKASKP